MAGVPCPRGAFEAGATADDTGFFRIDIVDANLAAAGGDAVGDFFTVGGPVGLGGVGGFGVQFFGSSAGGGDEVNARAASLIGDVGDLGAVGRPGGRAVGPAGLGQPSGGAARGGEGADFGVAKFRKAEGEGGTVGGEGSPRILARELGDDGAFFTIEIDDISIAVATFVGAVGNFGSVGGELGAVAKSGVLGELAGVGSVDVRKIDLFYLGFFSAGGGGEGDSAGGEAWGSGESFDKGIGKLVSGAAGIATEGGVNQRGTACFRGGTAGESRWGKGAGEGEGGGGGVDDPAGAGALEIVLEDFGDGRSLGTGDGRDRHVHFAGLFDDDNGGGGLGEEQRGEKK